MAEVNPQDRGPITVGEFPSEIYTDYENRMKTLSAESSLIQDSSIIAAQNRADSLGIRPDQLSIENNDVDRNRLFSSSDRPSDFSSDSLFQGNSIMNAFGPEENQLNDIEKVDTLLQGPTTHSLDHASTVTVKEGLEQIAYLNSVATEVKNQIYGLRKG